MRRKIVAGNWKMNLTRSEARSLIQRLKEMDTKEDVIIGIFAPAIHIDLCQKNLKGIISIGAQNCYTEPKGAYTGEISTEMIKSYDCDAVLIGHSERRQVFGESNQLLKKKVDAATRADLSIMFCIGETLEQRESGRAEEIVKQQLEESIFHLSADQFSRVIIAYEPVWAIGTGKAATPSQAQEMHAFIRKLVEQKYNAETAENTSILYGGSVKPDNAEEIFSNPDIDGGLIGGASLLADDFSVIANAI